MKDNLKAKTVCIRSFTQQVASEENEAQESLGRVDGSGGFENESGSIVLDLLLEVRIFGQPAESDLQ